MSKPGDEFTLYDLRVEVVAKGGPMVCNHKAGDYFELSGENLSLPPGQTFPIYPLAALLPLLPARQRETHPNDWMTTDTEIACPDPHCGAVFRITRTGKRTFRHSDVSAVPLANDPRPTGAMIEKVQLAEGYTIPRIIVGGWQLSAGHSQEARTRDQLFAALGQYVDAGLSTFDCADIYGGVELLLGEFRDWYRERKGADAARGIQVHTKFVPDRDELPRISRGYVEQIIDRSLRRLKVERLDLVQFHWWDLEVPGYLETAGWLEEMRAAGKIRSLGATNFDSPRLAELLEAGVKIVSHQVQYSLIDRRPDSTMADLCVRHGVRLLCYGAVAGGFLSERYLGSSEPPASLPNRSLVKYRLIIDEFGGWAAFQDLLETLGTVARKHGAAIANVALRWVLDRPQVGAAIVGAHDASHLEQNLKAFYLKLDSEDRRRIEQVLEKHSGPSGDVYHLERDGGGKHAAIMRYNLNREG